MPLLYSLYKVELFRNIQIDITVITKSKEAFQKLIFGMFIDSMGPVSSVGRALGF
jgi:hypothetical protein